MCETTPERIWLGPESAVWYSEHQKDSGSTEYIRADIHERVQSQADFLSREQEPVHKRYEAANAMVKKAEVAARKMIEYLDLPLHTRSWHGPGSWQHDLAAIAHGQWSALPEEQTDG